MGILSFIKDRKERKEREMLQKAAEEKARYQNRKKLINSFLEAEYQKRRAESESDYLKAKKRADKVNGTCPICGSTNVVHSIKRSKGEVHGDGHSHSLSYIFSHSHSSIFNLDGKVDTYPVNRCKDCENEWNVEEVYNSMHYNPYSVYESFGPMSMCDDTVKYMEQKWDPKDRTDEFASLDEKREAFLEKTRSCLWFEDYKNAPKEVLEYIAYQNMAYHKYDDDARRVFRPKTSDDEYSYTFPDDVWETVKLVIGWTGPDAE